MMTAKENVIRTLRHGKPVATARRKTKIRTSA